WASRSRSSSPRSSTTRSTRCGASTSRSPPRRSPTTRRARSSPRSASRSRPEREPMAKLAVKLRNEKRRKTVEKFKAKRAGLLEIINDARASDEARDEARAKLQKLPRDASPVRIRNRCALTGRPRGVYRKFGLGRNKLRELALRGEVPGIIKASW